MDGREYMYVRTALSNFELVIIRLLPSSLPSSFSGNSCTFMVMARQPKCHSRDATGSRNDLTWPDLIRLRFYSAQSQCQWGRKEGRKKRGGTCAAAAVCSTSPSSPSAHRTAFVLSSLARTVPWRKSYRKAAAAGSESAESCLRIPYNLNKWRRHSQRYRSDVFMPKILSQFQFCYFLSALHGANSSSKQPKWIHPGSWV